MVAALNLTGAIYGRLTCVGPAGSDRHGKRLWAFNCECGGSITTVGSQVKNVKVVSCGCRAREVGQANAIAGRDKIAASKRKHGGHGIPEYFVWKTMRQRCSNPNNKDYSQYGGRGVVVCPQWADFRAFFSDMGPRPSDSHSIDRIDPDGPYAPDNCRWATASMQRLNQRRMKNNGNLTL